MLTRFAPSPTGYLHLGNIRIALCVFLCAKQNNGQFMLRLDDTDRERSTEHFVAEIFTSLRSLGLQWDVLYKQSDHCADYNQAIEVLKNKGYIYPCYETSEELEVKRKISLGRKMPPIYDRSALNLTIQEKNNYERAGRKPHFRFKLRDEAISWHDEIKGDITFRELSISDPIVQRSNGSYTYLLPSAVDDINCNVTHVIRGEDHLVNTAVQIQIIQALQGEVPRFAHIPLMHTAAGKMSKRSGGYDVKNLLSNGIEPMTINSYLAKINTSEPLYPYTSLEELAEHFSLCKFNKTSAQFDLKELQWLNSKLLPRLDHTYVNEKLGIDYITKPFWQVIRSNINTISEVEQWWKICHTDIAITIREEDRTVLRLAYELLPQKTLDVQTCKQWLTDIAQKSSCKGKKLFIPLRLALTGCITGPALPEILPMLERSLIEKRLYSAL